MSAPVEEPVTTASATSRILASTEPSEVAGLVEPLRVAVPGEGAGDELLGGQLVEAEIAPRQTDPPNVQFARLARGTGRISGSRMYAS
jgi:hypothetical protein